jgi:hypothetical protein
MAAKVNQRNGETKLKMKNPLRKKEMQHANGHNKTKRIRSHSLTT